MEKGADTRERLLDAARRLFYRDGIHRSGVEALAAEAGVAKPTIYNVFGSKDALILEALRTRYEARKRWLAERLAEAEEPRARLQRLIDLHCEALTLSGFRGCPLVVAAQEIPESHIARETAALYKEWVRSQLESAARQAGLERPEDLSWKLLLLIEGATVMGYVMDAPALATRVGDLAAELVGAHDRGGS